MLRRCIIKLLKENSKMENNKRIINGYLECDGSIVKITSFEEIKAFITKFGKSISEMTESELDALTEQSDNDEKRIKDDCDVFYLSNPSRLESGARLESYKVQEGTLSIMNNAFRKSAYSYNEIMTSVYIPDSVLCIGAYAFYMNRGLQLLRMSNNLIKIGEESFGFCSKLSRIILPNTLQIIGARAFNNCSITEITIPASVRKIGAHAFKGCKSLKYVSFEGIPQQINSGLFDECKSLEKIIVPKTKRDYYIKALFPMDSKLIVEKQL